MPKIIDLKGKKFGKLKVIKMSEKRSETNRIMWECFCECGKEHITSGDSLRGGKSKSCGCNRLNPHNKEIDRELALWKQLYLSTIVKRSKAKGYKSNIDFDSFVDLSKKECHYCGLKNSNSAKDRRKLTRNGTSRELRTSETTIKFNGIDRVDSKKGYYMNNVVACCKFCNTAKNTLSNDDYLEFIKRVYSYSLKKETNQTVSIS